ncbi:coactosin-like protein isoform X1 [Ictidomys tridecemlineatus]
MATKIDKEACRAAYNLVRDDNSAVIWVTFKYEGSTIVPGEQGAEYQHFIQQCTEFCKRVCDQRSEGAGGRFHQGRAEEGGGRQLRRPGRVALPAAPLPEPPACCRGGDGGLTPHRPPAEEKDARPRPPPRLPSPRPPARPVSSWSSWIIPSSILFFLSPLFLLLKKDHFEKGHAGHQT